MKTLRRTGIIFGLLAGALAIGFPAAQAGEGPVPGVQGDLLSSNPRLKTLIAEANRASAPEEIERLTDAGVDATVVQRYVETSSRRYRLGADELIQLHQRGVPSKVLVAMLQKQEIGEPAPPPASTASVQPNPATASSRSQSPALESASTVFYLRDSPRPIRYPSGPRYAAIYPRVGWAPGAYFGFGSCWDYPGSACGPVNWTYRPAWSYDFRFSGCW